MNRQLGLIAEVTVLGQSATLILFEMGFFGCNTIFLLLPFDSSGRSVEHQSVLCERLKDFNEADLCRWPTEKGLWVDSIVDPSCGTFMRRFGDRFEDYTR